MDSKTRVHVWCNDLRNYLKHGHHALEKLAQEQAEQLSRIQQEIDGFRSEETYNFAGAILPSDIDISADSFFNVLLPHVSNLATDMDSINAFYVQLRKSFSRLHFHQDVVTGRKIIEEQHTFPAHGFPYFAMQVEINPGDCVFDCGAYPGDFAAVAVARGAQTVFAVEGDVIKCAKLDEISRLNQNRIIPVSCFVGATHNKAPGTISLDQYVVENNIEKIDFIKMDIEGAEEEAMRGAQMLLAVHRPKLAICTYHRKTAFQDIQQIIRDANPQYRIFDGKGILFGWID